MRKFIRDFLQLESASGIVLLAAALCGLLLANTPLVYLYESFKSSWLFLINEGLMAVFFLLVGLELKRGFIEDKFSRASDVLLPLAAAAGGMILPAAIYSICNYNNPDTIIGWATPVATDIAFAIGILSLVGNKVPKELRLFLLSIAIYDDIGAILIIAFFYSKDLSLIYLFCSGLIILALLFLNAFKIRYLCLYLIGGFLLWLTFLKGGIHPTIAGVVTAFLIPEIPYEGVTPVHYLESRLHPWVAYLIMPLFAFANTGLSLADISMQTLLNTVTIGIVLGLFIGKQLGVAGITWLSMKTTRWAKMPAAVSWGELYGVALLCGIGFTMSLFLGTLSFQGQTNYINEVRLGVIIGSFLSGAAGAIVLAAALNKRQKSRVN
ncbi:MAG TPA: Na+/H+ antiporter NhaA [Gammaproteobacteria bacterium]|jgi:NhaA family Na+:H+ antiporter|nr:Na+/H+ antiporter NhaA [Gammaproteobacteria bacterium]